MTSAETAPSSAATIGCPVAGAVGNRVARTAGRTVGYYSPAVVCPPGASLVAVSGVLSVDLQGDSVGAGDFELQMRTVFGLLADTLAAAGSCLAHLAKMTTYLVDADHIADFYRIREELFVELYPGGNPPGNTLLVVQRLVRPEFLIEIEGLATTCTTPIDATAAGAAVTPTGGSNEFVG